MKRVFILIRLWLIIVINITAESPTYDKVAKLYVATFNRAPDAAGLEYWVSKSELPLEGVAMSFFDQPETKSLYPSSYSNSDFVDAIYQNVFGRKPDKAGKDYWLHDLNNRYIARSEFILAVINGALGDDAVLLENKTEVALEYAQKGYNNIDEAKKIMKLVTSDRDSVEEALDELNRYALDDCREKGEDEYCIDIDDDSLHNVSQISDEYIPEKIGWYLRLVAVATLDNGRSFVQNKEGVFGEYSKSIDGKDRHDIPSLGTDILRVVFVHTDWGDAATYYSDYRAYHPDSSNKEVWTVQIKNDRDVNLANASLKLYLEGVYEILDNRGEIEEKLSKDDSLKQSLKIVDVDNHSVYVYGDSKSVNLSMDGKHTRTFRIVRGDVSDDDYKPIESVESRSLFRIENRSEQTGFGPPPSL